MIRFAQFVFFIFVLAACSQNKVEERTTILLGNDIIGIASPIQLNIDTTHINLKDYFETPSRVDSLSFSADFPFTFDPYHGMVEVVLQKEADALSYLNITYAGTAYTIPVYGSKQKAYPFEFNSPTPGLTSVSLKGNFNGWNASATPLSLNKEKWTTVLYLEPGLYEYLVVIDGKELLDPNNPDKKSNGMGGENSTFQVGNPDLKLEPISTYRSANDSLKFVYSNTLKDPIVLYNNHLLTSDNWVREQGILSLFIPLPQDSTQRNFIRVMGMGNGMRTNEIRIPLEGGHVLERTIDLNRKDQHAMAMYFMMIDRFVNGDTLNDQQVEDPEILPQANYYGGDLRGVVDAIEADYFDALSMNTIWLSPITQNPLTAYGLWDKGGVRSKFSGYHGYWPISSTEIDFRFGDEAELQKLIERAHAHDENVIVDYVANHVHELHPVYQQHPDWATELYLPDGSLNTERWDEHRLTTWFDMFLPTLDLQNQEVVAAMTDSALFWFQNYDIDGFRHDATKHIPLDFWRSLTRKLKYQVVQPEERAIYQIGETYGNPDLIGSYVGSGLLDGQFDFNLYDAAVFAFANSQGSFHELSRVLNQGLEAYGAHHLMGNISGNQDRTRFISYADGSVRFDEDPKQAGWSREIKIQGEKGYQRLAMLHAFNFSIPGIPVIYYGDEIGLPGANDPDNRRMMRFDKDLSDNEKELLAQVQQITRLRKEHMAFIFGDTEILHVTDNQFALLRSYFDQTALTVFNTSDQQETMRFAIPPHLNTENLKSNFGSKFTIDAGMFIVNLPPNSFEIITN